MHFWALTNPESGYNDIMSINLLDLLYKSHNWSCRGRSPPIAFPD